MKKKVLASLNKYWHNHYFVLFLIFFPISFPNYFVFFGFLYYTCIDGEGNDGEAKLDTKTIEYHQLKTWLYRTVAG